MSRVGVESHHHAFKRHLNRTGIRVKTSGARPKQVPRWRGFVSYLLYYTGLVFFAGKRWGLNSIFQGITKGNLFVPRQPKSACVITPPTPPKVFPYVVLRSQLLSFKESQYYYLEELELKDFSLGSTPFLHRWKIEKKKHLELLRCTCQMRPHEDHHTTKQKNTRALAVFRTMRTRQPWLIDQGM